MNGFTSRWLYGFQEFVSTRGDRSIGAGESQAVTVAFR